MEPKKLFEIFEEVTHAEQRSGEMVSRHVTVKIPYILQEWLWARFVQSQP